MSLMSNNKLELIIEVGSQEVVEQEVYRRFNQTEIKRFLFKERIKLELEAYMPHPRHQQKKNFRIKFSKVRAV